jgi:hypothetical protein
LINARDWRVLQIPNGTKFTCSNCHIDPNGGGARNKFGQDVEKLVSVGGHEEFWKSALAKLDSDGDGKTNGQELNDPDGVWRSGQPNPGVSSSVTNPGNQASVTSVGNVAGLPAEYKLYNNYPNPFNPSTKIKFNIPEEAFAKLIIYDLLGKEVKTLVNSELKPGTYEVNFDAIHFASGIYFYSLQTNNFKSTKKLLITK